MVLPGDARTSGPEYGPGGLEVPGSRKDLSIDYFSQGNGSLVSFGKGHGNAPSPGFDSDFLRHRDGPGAQSRQEETMRGVLTSKFKTGFNRRQYGDIQQDSERKMREAMKEDKSARHLERRRGRLSEHNTYNGFNPITGQVDPNRGLKKDPNNWLLDGKPSKVQVGEGEPRRCVKRRASEQCHCHSEERSWDRIVWDRIVCVDCLCVFIILIITAAMVDFAGTLPPPFNKRTEILLSSCCFV